MNAERLRNLVYEASKMGASEALCNQCIFDLESINILNTVVKIGKKFKGFIILGLALALVAMCFSGLGIAYLIFSGGLLT